MNNSVNLSRYRIAHHIERECSINSKNVKPTLDPNSQNARVLKKESFVDNYRRIQQMVVYSIQLFFDNKILLNRTKMN